MSTLKRPGAFPFYRELPGLGSLTNLEKRLVFYKIYMATAHEPRREDFLAKTANQPPMDQLGRPFRDLRISVTDRCNFRCDYCMPADRDYSFQPRNQLLTFEEIAEVARISVNLGVRKLRLTGGEPLLRRDLPRLIEMLAAIGGIEDIALTTNGFLLSGLAERLKRAGLRRVTVSLDSLDPGTFQRLTASKTTPARILAAMDDAAAKGLGVKVNMVVQKGVNDHEIPNMAALFKERGFTLRFIEYMDVGNLNQWRSDQVLTAAEILDRVRAQFDFEPLRPAYPGEVARRYAYRDGCGQFGIIASVSQPFCGQCTRGRLSAEGRFYTCLFASEGADFRGLLRGPEGAAGVARLLRALWAARADRYSELRGRNSGKEDEKVEMYHIGG